ncbi:UEV domain-containing protein [Geranomyces variabilis]|nr:UEV domain-containing protein [Geranomyces variabilis]KAJ3135742.1 hypothetical protein HDU90_003818 [Geranomyces variabilis]
MDATRTWLRGVLGPQYQQRERVFRDADAVLVSYNGLAPKTDAYTHEDGRTVVLLCMHGTIPITFRNITYNIPVALWVPHGYPSQPPICFVTPTSTMLVRASKHVDLSGKVYHPYLAYWHMNTEESTLLAFVRVLQEVFALEPPVYTKPSNAPVSVPPAHNNAYQSLGYAGQSQQSSQPAVNSSTSKSYQEPARLQQPQPQTPQQHQQQQQQHHHSRGNQPPLQQPQPGYSNQPPQYQPSPPQQHLSMPDARRHTTPSPASMLNQQPPPIPPPPPNYLRGSNNSPHANSQPYQSQSPQQQQSQRASSQQQPHAPPPPPPKQTATGGSVAPPPVPHKPLAASIDTQAYQSAVDERTAKLNAIRDALRARLREKEAELNATLPREIERLLNVNRGLEDGGARVKKAIKDAAEHENDIKAAIEAVQQKTTEVVEQTATIQAQPDVNIDTLLDGPSVVHNQLIDLVAQDHAIDDTLYYLGKALDAERIDGAVYMKAVRGLAREQFIKRAMIRKIRIYIGLERNT